VELMADVGMSEFCQSAKSLDIDLLIRQFTELESRSAELRQAIMERNLANVRQLEQQFADVSALFSRPENQRRVPSACVECGAND
jgi:hypothetical protein